MPASIDESAEIEFHVELSPPSSDVEMEIVEESFINMETENEIKLLDLQFKSMHLGSIVIVHRQLTDQAIRKLQEACHTGEINRYIKSLFTPEYVEKMKRDGVTGLVLKITAKKSQQEEQKLLKQMKITQETMCWNETYLASEIPDTTRNVTGRELQENASFLLDELEPKEYVQAFDSILPQDVLVGLTADIDRRKRVKLFVDEIVEKGQQAVDIFVGELERLERHHVLNILKGSCLNTSGINIDQIAFQIRTSIVNNYDIFVDELEPKRYATFCMEKRTMDKAAYEKICKHPSRRNRAVAFFKWLLDEQKPDAYIAFQKAVGIFSSDKFVKLLETTVSQSTSGVTSPAADHTNDDASTRVLLYLATSEITFSKDATCSASRQNQGEIIRAATDDATPDEINETSSETYMLPNPTVTVNDEKHENKLHKHERDSEPGLYAKTLRCIQIGQALFRKSTSQWRPVRINQRGTKQLLQSPEESHSSNIDPHIQKMTEEKEKLVVNDVLPNSPDKEVFSVVYGNEHSIEVLKYERDSESRPLNDTTLHSIPNITFKKKVPKWLSEKSRNNSTTHCFSLPENTNSSNDDHDKHLLHHQIETTSSELVSDPKTESEEVPDSSTNKEGKEEWDGQSSKTESCTQVYIQNPNMDEEGTISTCVDSVLDLSNNGFNHSLPAGSTEGAKSRCHSPDSSHSSKSRKRHYQTKDLIPKETISHHEKVSRWLLLDVTNDFDSCASPPISNDLATIQGKPLSDSIGTTHGNLSGGSKAESGVIPGAIQDGKSNKSYKDIVKKEHKTSIANVIVDDNVSVSDQGYISHQDHNDFDQATISSSASSKFDTSSVKTTESNSTMREESELGPIDVSLIKLQSFRINSSKLDQTQYYSTMKRCADIKDQ